MKHPVYLFGLVALLAPTVFASSCVEQCTILHSKVPQGFPDCEAKCLDPTNKEICRGVCGFNAVGQDILNPSFTPNDAQTVAIAACVKDACHDHPDVLAPNAVAKGWREEDDYDDKYKYYYRRNVPRRGQADASRDEVPRRRAFVAAKAAAESRERKNFAQKLDGFFVFAGNVVTKLLNLVDKVDRAVDNSREILGRVQEDINTIRGNKPVLKPLNGKNYDDYKNNYEVIEAALAARRHRAQRKFGAKRRDW
eukprot:comp18330_c0_seq1/m.19415 comp18330_c0_seq1/g.19415  ORF comp18330_c0_seq1/g.19415 comp18330_c0_seq1/m.19415 type:complete len:252 (-) comp18330_c0_seq1:154-909(-)